MKNSITTLASVIALTFLAGTTLAQEAAPAGGLEGPKVTEPSAPGVNRKFTSGGGNKEAVRPTPMPIFVRAFGVLRGDKADDATRLSEDQIASLEKIGEAHRAAMTAYVSEHRAEIEALRDALPPEERRRVDGRLRELSGGRGERGPDGVKGGKPPKGERPAGDAPDAMDPMSDAPSKDGAKPEKATGDAMGRLRELMEGAPNAADAQAKMWAVLTEAQRPVVEKELARVKEEASKRGAERGKGKGAGKGDGQVDMEALPPRLRERLENMTPEEREKAIKAYRERRGNGGNKPE
jgi:hypothetical protein